MERSRDESAAVLPRRKSSGLKSFLFRKYGFGHIFHVWQGRTKETSGEGGLVKCSSSRNDCNSCEIVGENRENDSEEYGLFKNARKNSLGKAFSWMKYNFLSSVISNSSSSSSSGHHSPAGRQEETTAAEISHSNPEFANEMGDLQETKPNCASSNGFSRGAGNLSQRDNSEMEKSTEVDTSSSECVNCAENGILEEDPCSSREIHAGKSYSDSENGRVSRKRDFRQFPPPLPSLARTGNLPCHMPWTLIRSYSADGRLVLQEVRFRRHEFFRAERSNGRLTLQLVQHDEEKVRASQAEMFSNAEAKRLRNGGVGHEDCDDEPLQGHEEESETSDENEAEDAAVAAAGNANNGRGRQAQCFSPTAFGATSSPHAHSAQSSGGIGIESPAAGCCAPPKNSLFQMPFPTIRPILS